MVAVMTNQSGRSEPRFSAGFTLIELLLVAALLGVLTALAITQFSVYRKAGYDARAASDLRNAASAEEAYFITNSTYVTCANCTPTDLPGFVLSDGVELQMTDNGPTFSGTAKHTRGEKTWAWDSGAGGLQ